MSKVRQSKISRTHVLSPDLNYRVTQNGAFRWQEDRGCPNVLGDVRQPGSGTAVFKINGQEVRLTDLGEDPSKGLFLSS